MLYCVVTAIFMRSRAPARAVVFFYEEGLAMKRVWVLAGILILALAPIGASAQGLFSGDWSGLAASLMGGSYSCGPKGLGPVFYVGYTYDPGNSTGLSADTRDGSLAGLSSLTQQYGMRGVWLGLSQTVPISDSFGIIASGWYLVPGGIPDTQEPYNYTSTVVRTWTSLKPEWWYADALGALGSLNGFALLGGFRYDRFAVKLSSPVNASGVPSLRSDNADVTSTGYIPLVGVQMAYAGSNYNLLFRVIGCPSLIGHVRYSETLAGASNYQASGNYKGTNFIEVFTEYGYRVSERSSMGLFGRFSSTRGASNLTMDYPTIAGLDAPFDVSIGRNSWTAGGQVSFQF
jgi:hypothetical protein